jgi:starvation-inducible DNA-binding protein
MGENTMATRPSTKSEAQHKINIGLSDEQREGVIEILKTSLADQYVLYLKTQKYHWNVVGPDFYQIHNLLREQYETLAEAIDETAERIRQIGGLAIGTMKEFLDHTRLEEQPGVYPNARDMLHDLLHDHEFTIRNLREAIDEVAEKCDDATTADFLTSQAEVHEKMAWMLGSMVADDHSLDSQKGR